MILHRYFALRFLKAFFGVLGAFAAMLGLIDLIEQIRRYGGEGLSFGEMLVLTLLSLPSALYRILPLIMILSTLALFLGLSRSSEMVVTRAAGRSAMRAVTAPISVAALTGMISVALFNPIVAATTNRYDVLSSQYQGEQSSALSVSDEGLWLRDGGTETQTVINASHTNPDGTRLENISFLGLDAEGSPIWRIEARSAELFPGAWRIEDGKRWQLDAGINPEATAERFDELLLDSDLTFEEIRASFGTPSSIPVWTLPQYIERLENAGFTARRHRVWLNMELANPVFYSAMVLVAAAFTLRHTRFGRTGLMVLGALLMAFSLYFVRNFAQILGENGQIPVFLAAWAPPIAALLLPLGLMLHLEDG